MNFSDLFKQTTLLCEFSPDGKYLANVVQFRLIIRDIQSLEVVNLFTCLDTINFIEVNNQLLVDSFIQMFELEMWLCSSGHQTLISYCAVSTSEILCRCSRWRIPIGSAKSTKARPVWRASTGRPTHATFWPRPTSACASQSGHWWTRASPTWSIPRVLPTATSSRPTASTCFLANGAIARTSAAYSPVTIGSCSSILKLTRKTSRGFRGARAAPRLPCGIRRSSIKSLFTTSTASVSINSSLINVGRWVSGVLSGCRVVSCSLLEATTKKFDYWTISLIKWFWSLSIR